MLWRRSLKNCWRLDLHKNHRPVAENGPSPNLGGPQAFYRDRRRGPCRTAHGTATQGRSETMNRFLASTALGFVLGLAPALAQDQPPADDTQAPPAATEQPAQPPEAMPSEPSDPGAPIPGDTSEAQPDPAMPPSAEAPSEPASPPSAEAPQSIEPAAPK